MRNCDGCTVCCTVTAVPELQKPERVTCTHCDKGCSIYPERPGSCRNFYCSWALGLVDERLKPDKTHVMFESLPGVKTVLLLCEPGHDGAWQQLRVREAISSFLVEGVAVVINAGSNKHMIVPTGRTRESVVADMHMALKNMEIGHGRSSLHN